MFKKGDKVICIGNFNWGDTFLMTDECIGFTPKKDEIFTVYGTKEFDGELYLYFEEVPTLGSDGDRDSFDASAFRKIVTHRLKNKVTANLVKIGLVQEGIERIIVEQPYTY